MHLTVIAPENVYDHDVDPSMEVQDLLALLEAETGLSSSILTLSTDSGIPLIDGKKTLEGYGLKEDTGTVFLTFPDAQPEASTSYARPSQPAGNGASGGFGIPHTDADLERMRLQALANPQLMSQLRGQDPEMADAIQAGGQRFRQAFEAQTRRMREAASEKQRQVELLNADPYDIEAQKKIEEAIRMEAVLENMQHAMEYSPESFGNVTMLYIDVEVNGHPVKAFVDSGAQTTIISPECAEACGIMRLLDRRFAGVALGVGTAQILGRIHSAQIRLGSLFLPCSFSVLEGKGVDLLFGLDMLKRHQCCIDLSTNTLRIQSTEIPFLAEHELPDKARQRDVREIAEELGEAAGTGHSPGVATTKRDFPGSGQALGSGGAAGSSTQSRGFGSVIRPTPSASTGTVDTSASRKTSFREEDIQTLVGLGALRDQAIQLLEASDGNVDVAASMLFG